MHDSGYLETIGKRIAAVRTLMGMDQQSFSARLKISTAHLSMIENGHRSPSGPLTELIICIFELDSEWLYEGKGEPFKERLNRAETGDVAENKLKRDPLEKRKTLARDALVAAAVLGPVMPYVSGSIAIGVGAATILNKIANAYGAKNIARLAKDYLHVDRSTIDYWLRTDKVPARILQQSIVDTPLEPEDFAQVDEHLIISKPRFVKYLQAVLLEKHGFKLKDEEANDLLEMAKSTDLK